MKTPLYNQVKVKKIIEENLNKEIYFIVRVSKGKTLKTKGIVLKAYKNIFTVEIEKLNQKQVLSFSYSDIISSKFKILSPQSL